MTRKTFAAKAPHGTIEQAREKARAFSRRKGTPVVYIVRFEEGTEGRKWWGEYNTIEAVDLEDYKTENVIACYEHGACKWDKTKPGNKHLNPTTVDGFAFDVGARRTKLSEDAARAFFTVGAGVIYYGEHTGASVLVPTGKGITAIVEAAIGRAPSLDDLFDYMAHREGHARGFYVEAAIWESFTAREA